MPFFNHITDDDLRDHFVYRGWLFGVVPVYVGNLSDPAPTLSTRNGIPEFWLDLFEALYGGFCAIGLSLVPGFTAEFPLHITGRLDGAPLEAGL